MSAPVIAVGGFRSLDLMQAVLESGDADFVALCRPFIREPDLVASWRAGVERRATCISCNKCFEQLLTGARLQCMVGKKGEGG